MQSTRRIALIMLSTGMLASCDESTGNDGTIEVTLTPAAVTITQGTIGTADVAIVRGGGFNETVTLSISGLPSGVFGTVIPSQLAATETAAELEVSAALFSVPGTYSLTITATGSSSLRATTSLQLTVMPAPDFRVTLATPSLTVTAGSSATANVNMERTNFADAITLELVSAPAGVTATFNPASPTGTSSVMTINVAPDVTPASYPLIVQGSSAAIGSRTANFQLNVQPQPGSFTITPTPGSFSLPRGNSSTVNIAIGRTDYSGPITLAFENPSPGITGTITPASTTGNAATFTFTVGNAVSAGIYTLRIRASAPGFIDRVAFITVTVTVPVGGTVDYLFCDPSTVPVFFAVQDGSGAWRSVTPTTNGPLTTFSHTFVQDRGGVLIVTRTTLPFVADVLGSRHSRSRRLRSTRMRASAVARVSRAPVAPLVDVYHTDVIYASTTELAQDGFANCRQTQGTKTITAALSNLTTGDVGIISLGSSTTIAFGDPGTTTVTLNDVPDGTLDLVASRQFNAGNPPNRLVVTRGLQLDDGAQIPVDFNGPSSLAPATASATLSGAGFNDLLELFVTLSTGNSEGQLWFDLAPNASNVRTWGGLASADRLADDLHGLFAFATPNSGVTGDFRVSGRYVGDVADQTLTFGPVINPPVHQEVATGSYPRYRFTGSVPADYNKGVSIDLAPRNGAGNTYSIVASSAWLAGAGSALSYDFTMPDLASLAGFPVASRLAPGPNDSAASGFGFTGQGIFALRPAPGMEFKAASRGFTVPVP